MDPINQTPGQYMIQIATHGYHSHREKASGGSTKHEAFTEVSQSGGCMVLCGAGTAIPRAPPLVDGSPPPIQATISARIGQFLSRGTSLRGWKISWREAEVFAAKGTNDIPITPHPHPPFTSGSKMEESTDGGGGVGRRVLASLAPLARQ